MSPAAVTTVDFLPADFHAQRRRRRVRRGRWVIAGAFLLLMLVGFAGNQVQRLRLRSELERLEPQAAGVAELRQSLTQLTQEIQLLDMRADVRSRLRFRPASPRLLECATTAIPDGVILHELEMREERPVATYSAPNRKSNDEKQEQPLEQLDLERLLADRSRQVLTIHGFAPTDAAVSEYLVELRRTGSFEDVTLLFTDRHEQDGIELRTFSVRVRVRAALGTDVAGAVTGGGDS
jgi:Tfp pilus assembly protein PilN